MNINLADASLSWVPPNNEERIGIRIQPQGNADASVTVWMRGPIDFLGFGIETYEFADATLSRDELMALLPPFPSVWEFEGTANADSLEGTDLKDILVGKAGDDSLEGRAGNDVYLFNAGDGFDYIYDYNGEDDAGIDTLSIGMGINPADVKAAYWIDDYGDETYYALFLYFDDTGTDGVFLDWLYTYNDGVDVYPENTNIEYIQFLDANGGQIFDLAAIVQARVTELTDAYDQDTPIQLFTPEVLANFDVTATVGLAGGAAAYNYATTGDIHTAPQTPALNEIQGTGASDTLIGTDGADRIDGGSGNDTIDGGLGNDVIIGGAGSDTLSGGAGDDTFLIEGTDGGYDSFDGGAGVDTILGGDGDDTIRLHTFSAASSVEAIDGGLGVNVIAGTGASNNIDLSGTTVSNIDHIDAGAGNDTVIGTAGADTIIGGAGSDTLSGGAGDDTFLIEGTDGGYDTFDGGAGVDTILGGDGDDTIRLHTFSAASSVEAIDGGLGVNVIAGTGASNNIDLSGTMVS